MSCPIRRIPLLIFFLSSLVWLLTAPAVSRTVDLNASEALLFPQPGPVPPNVSFLIALEFPRGRDLPGDPSPSSLLLDPEASRVYLIDDADRPISLEMGRGPHGLVTAVPESELLPGRRYRLMVEGQSNMLDALRARVGDRFYEVVGKPDTSPPQWNGAPSIEAARRASEDCLYWLDCDDERELDFFLPVQDEGGLMLLWSDAPLDGSKPPQLRYKALRGSRADLCCFEPNDRVVRFETVDAAGNRSRPDPPMLAFGD